MTTYLVTHATRSWVPRMAPYLESLSAHSPFVNWFLTVDTDAPVEFMERFPRVSAMRVPKTAGSPEYSDSLQHGAFIDFIAGADDDVLIYTDGDILMQRPPETHELVLLAGIGKDAVVAGYNSGPSETLAVEAGRLFPRGELAGWGDTGRPCFNVGVIAARRSTWRAIHTLYMANWERVCDQFQAPQRQQWLICWCLAELGLTVHIPGYGWHANGHYGIPPGVSINGTAHYNGELVLFRHHL